MIFFPSKNQSAQGLNMFKHENFIVIDRIRSYRDNEFTNKTFSSHIYDQGIKHEFSTARSPQQNDVSKRRNQTLKKTTRKMIVDYGIFQSFWTEAVNTTCYTQNNSIINRKLIQLVMRS